MPDDDLTNTLLTDYVATAKNLQSGVNVTAETLNRYHGMTGTLLAKCVTALWTQTELEEQIDKRMEHRCKTCPNAIAIQQLQSDGCNGSKPMAFIRALTPFRWPAAVAVFSPFAGDFVTKMTALFK